MGFLKVLALLSALIFYFITFMYYQIKDRREFYDREGLKTQKERRGKYFHYVRSQSSWSNSFRAYRGNPPSYVKKTLLVLVILAFIVNLIPS